MASWFSSTAYKSFNKAKRDAQDHYFGIIQQQLKLGRELTEADTEDERQRILKGISTLNSMKTNAKSALDRARDNLAQAHNRWKANLEQKEVEVVNPYGGQKRKDGTVEDSVVTRTEAGRRVSEGVAGSGASSPTVNTNQGIAPNKAPSDSVSTLSLGTFEAEPSIESQFRHIEDTTVCDGPAVRLFFPSFADIRKVRSNGST